MDSFPSSKTFLFTYEATTVKQILVIIIQGKMKLDNENISIVWIICNQLKMILSRFDCKT